MLNHNVGSGLAVVAGIATQPSTMTSREIAELTGKNHADVMRDVRNMLAALEVDQSSFADIFFDSYGRPQPCFKLPQDETICLMTGYEPKARMAVIKRWKELEAGAVAVVVADPLANLPAEQRALVAVMLDNVSIKRVQAEQADANKRIEANQIAAVASVQSFTAMGYSNYRDLQLSKLELAKLGRKAAAISKKRGLTVDHVADSRYGRVGSYHLAALDQAFEEMAR